MRGFPLVGEGGSAEHGGSFHRRYRLYGGFAQGQASGLPVELNEAFLVLSPRDGSACRVGSSPTFEVHLLCEEAGAFSWCPKGAPPLGVCAGGIGLVVNWCDTVMLLRQA